MATETGLLTALALGLAATAYASVGHGGASAYWTVFALMGLALGPLKPTVLVMNILVSSLALFHFARREPLAWRTLLPLIAGSIPMAWLGGKATTPDLLLKITLAVMLAVGALRLWLPAPSSRKEVRPLAPWLGLSMGAAIGYLAGLTGTGGGVLLTPILILMGWATVTGAAGLSAAFILVNSLATLLPLGSKITVLPVAPAMALTWVLTAFVGGLLGSRWGSGHRPPLVLKRVLAAVLVVGVVKLTVI